MTLHSDDGGTQMPIAADADVAVVARPSNRNRQRINCINWLKSINVEPCLLLSSIAFGIKRGVFQPFLYWRTCVDLYYSEVSDVEHFCDALPDANGTDFRDRVETAVNNFTIYFSIVNCLPALLLCPVIGAWSDKTGMRKIPLMVGEAVEVVTTIVYLVTSMFTRISVYWLFLGAHGFTGILSSTFSLALLADSGGASSRTLRLAGGIAIRAGGGVLGSLLYSLFVSQLGPHSYIIVFLVTQGFSVLTFMYILVFVRDIRTSSRRSAPVSGSGEYAGDSLLQRLKQTGQTLYMRRDGKLRSCLHITLIARMMSATWRSGVGGFLLLYLKRPPFNWSDTLWGIFTAYEGSLSAIGMLLVPALIQRVPVRSKESLVCLIGLSAHMVMYVLYSILNSTLWFFIADSLELIATSYATSFTTILIKIVAEDETARIFAVAHLLEYMTPMIGTSFFNFIYNSTLHVWPRISLLVAAASHIPLLFCMSFVHVSLLSEEKRRLNEEHEKRLVDENPAEDEEEEDDDDNNKNG